MIVSILLPRQGTWPALPSVAAGDEEGELSSPYALRVSFPTGLGHWWTVGEGSNLSLSHATTGQMSNADSSPLLTTSWLAHLCFCQQGWLSYTVEGRCRACCPKCCTRWQAESVLLPFWPQCQLSHLPYALAGWVCVWSIFKCKGSLHSLFCNSSFILESSGYAPDSLLPTHPCFSVSLLPLWGYLQMHCLSRILHDLLLHFIAQAAMSTGLISPPPPFFFSYFFSLLCLLSLCFLPVMEAATNWKNHTMQNI